MEYELLCGFRRNTKKPRQVLYLPNEKCLFVKNDEQNGRRVFVCYQKVLCVNKKKTNRSETHLKCLARAYIDENDNCWRNDKPHTSHENHLKIVADMKSLNNIKSACEMVGSIIPSHKVSTKYIFTAQTARYFDSP